ncbi:MAG: substrate-binding domain-containing protein [Candidatus Cryptobacteroides sp.]
MNKKITINDVAQAAGVSKGTVDRVLHNRGEVSAKSRKRVLEVIEELGFKPNLYASMLASRKVCNIACIFPESDGADFWSFADRGVEQARDEVARFGVSVSVFNFDQYDEDSFSYACKSVLNDNPSAVVLAPIFADSALKFVKELSDKGIPYTYVDSKPDDDGYLAYFGMPMYQSGVLCGDILTDGRKPNKAYIIRIERDKKGLSDPTVGRRKGFTEFMRAHFPDCELVSVMISPKDKESRFKALDRAFEGDDSENKFIVMFNSRVHLVVDYLRERNMKNCRMVGFDVLEKNIQGLRDGYVNILIAQHADRWTYDAIKATADHILGLKSVEVKDNYTPMDILSKYNCDYYG